MRIDYISLKNFKVFKDIEIENITRFSVFVGANGSGKSTIFGVFEFLHEAMIGNIDHALVKLGGARGFKEVRSRGASGPIEIILGIVLEGKGSFTYTLKMNEEYGKSYVENEILAFWHFGDKEPDRLLDFSRGKGRVYKKIVSIGMSESNFTFEEQTLKAPNILAIKALSQFERFPAIVALGNLIENWHLSDFHISKARPEQEAGYAEHLSREGENLSLVVQYLHDHHPEVFAKILELMKRRVPGISRVTSKTTEEGRVLLKFQDGSFEDPFLARHVSDGTIKMLAYLTLLYDPNPHPLLCVEEPENQLYPKLLWELAEEFRAYANRGGQVFVSTHSPDFLNAVRPEEVFWLVKKDGYTQVKRASDDPQIMAYMKEGDQMGYLWKQGFFEGADPE